MLCYRTLMFYIVCSVAAFIKFSLGAEIKSMTRIMSSETGTVKSSMELSSLLECRAWGQIASEPLEAISYNPGSGICAINKLGPYAIYKAVCHPEEGSQAYYVDPGCIPSYCPDPDTFKTDTDAFPADLIYFTPLVGKSGSSLDVDVYFTSSLTKTAQSFSVQLWDEPFLDGSFPFWHPENNNIPQGHIALSPNIVIGSMSVFAWAYFKSSANTPIRPVSGFHRSTIFNSGFGLTGGGTTSYVDKLTFWITDHISGPRATISDEAIIKEDVWQHLGATYDATSGESHLYYNGEIVKSDNLGAGIQTHALQLGLLNTGLSLDGTTSTDPFAACQGCASLYHEIYERALSPTEAKKIYNRVNCQFPADYCNFY